MRLLNYLVVASTLMSICAANITGLGAPTGVLPQRHRFGDWRNRVKRVSTPYFSPKTKALAKYCVSIRSRTPRKFFGDNHFCGGFVITPNFIMTAAHCAMDKRKILHRSRVLLIVVATPNRLKFVHGQTLNVPVKEIFVHRNFTMYNTNNIALMRLANALPTNNPHIGFIKLPTGPPIFEEMYTVIGWGNLENILDENPCAGDTGAPMISNGTAFGVVAYRLGCGSKELPSVYTNIWLHLDWVETVLAAASASSLKFYWICGVLVPWISR